MRGSQATSNKVFAAWAAGDFGRTLLNAFNTVRQIGSSEEEEDVFVGEISLGICKEHELFDSGGQSSNELIVPGKRGWSH